jgi:hypothetical protein
VKNIEKGRTCSHCYANEPHLADPFGPGWGQDWVLLALCIDTAFLSNVIDSPIKVGSYNLIRLINWSSEYQIINAKMTAHIA